MRFKQLRWDPAYSIVEPQINAEGVHVWPFDPEFPIDFRTFINSGRNARINRHEYCEIGYIYDGECDFRVQGRSLRARKGDLIVVGVSLYHHMVVTPPSRVKLAVIYFKPELLTSDCQAEGSEYLMPFFQQAPGFPHVIAGSTGIPDEVFEFARRIQSELPAESSRGRLAVKTYLKLILMLLVNHYAEHLGTQESFLRQQRDLAKLRPFFDYIEQNYDRRIQVKQAARLCGMSSSHWMPFFKRVTGQTFLAYVNHFRVAKAQELLVSTDKPLADISQELGFCDQSHFRLVFQRVSGINPLAYRRRFAVAAKPSEILSAADSRPAA